MNKRIKKKKKTLEKKIIDNVQGRTKTPAVLKKNIDDINSLETRKWVEEREL